MSTSLEQRSEANNGLSGSAGQALIQFKDEGVNLGTSGTVTTVNFTGAGVTASRVANTVTVNVPVASQLPVGSIYENVLDATNPATLLGYGTWLALGAGRVLVGIDVTDPNFDTLAETGGATMKAISAHAGTAVGDHTAHAHTSGTLGTSSGSAHSHGSGTLAPSVHSATTVGNHVVTQPNSHGTHGHDNGTLAIYDHTGLSHVHNFTTGSITGSGDIGDKVGAGKSITGTTGDNGPPTQTHTFYGTIAQSAALTHTGTAVDAHAVTGPGNHTMGGDTATEDSHTHTVNSGSTSSDALSAHGVTQPSVHADLNVLQPYIVVHRWYRSA